MGFYYALLGIALAMVAYVLLGPTPKRVGQAVLVWLLLGAAAYLFITWKG